MEITSIDIRSTMGVHAADIKLDTPITIFAGGNYSGKSSLLESVRMALGDNPVRVSLKKEFVALVTEGAKSGRVNVVMNGEEYGIAFPTGKRFGPVETSEFLPFVLDASRFTALKPGDMRTLLFRLTGCAATPAIIKALMIERACEAAKVDLVLPVLSKGFPAAEEFAKEKARTAKSDWKAITNEAWGANKSEDWTAPVPEFNAARAEKVSKELAQLDTDISEVQRNVGALSERYKQYTAWQSGESARKALAIRIPELKKKLETDEAELADWTKQVDELTQRAGTGPRIGLIHELAGAVNFYSTKYGFEFSQHEAAMKAYEAQYGAIGGEGDPEAKAKLPDAIKSRDLMDRAVANDKRDIASAEAAAAASAKPVEAVSKEQLDALNLSLTKLTERRAALNAERTELDRAGQATKAAESNTKKAAQHNADVSAWLLIADALAPDGIPGEILGKALGPFNDRLRESSQATGWFQASINADMVLTAGGRPYPLLSESEKWRVDAMTAEAISHLAGLKLLALDGADVLEPKARPQLLGWLDAMAIAEEIDTAIVCITLKQPPSGLPPTMAAYWVKEGRFEDLAALAEAA